jgi:hypothetical protein
MERDSSIEFDFRLAEMLGMTVETVRQTMSHHEWMQWTVVMGRRAQREEVAARKARRNA